MLMYDPMNHEGRTVPLVFSSIPFLTALLSFHPQNAPLLQTAFRPPKDKHWQMTAGTYNMCHITPICVSNVVCR